MTIKYPSFIRDGNGITILWHDDTRARDLYKDGDEGKAILAELDAATDGGKQVKILERVIGEAR